MKGNYAYYFITKFQFLLYYILCLIISMSIGTMVIMCHNSQKRLRGMMYVIKFFSNEEKNITLNKNSILL